MFPANETQYIYIPRYQSKSYVMQQQNAEHKLYKWKLFHRAKRNNEHKTKFTQPIVTQTSFFLQLFLFGVLFYFFFIEGLVDYSEL